MIETADLKKLAQAVSGETLIGKLFTTGSKSAPADADEVVRLIGDCPHNRLAVEEQDHAFYVIHFSNEPNDIKWLMVKSTSPMFMDLRNRHTRWMAERPGWDGWIVLALSRPVDGKASVRFRD
jgi:hypothetical protein